jgi:hypothetical protein
VAAVLVGILVASLVSAGRGNGGDAQQSSQQAAPPDKPNEQDYERAIRDYYALLPEGTNEAYQLLTGRAKRKSGGEQQYEAFWNTIDAVSVEDISAQGRQVEAVLLYDKKDGSTVQETTAFELVQKNGQLLISDFDRVDGGDGE